MLKKSHWLKSLKALSMLVVSFTLLGILAACGTAATNTPAPTTAAPTTAAVATTAAATTAPAQATTAAPRPTTVAAVTTAPAPATTAAATTPTGKLTVAVRAIPVNLNTAAEGDEYGFAPQNYVLAAYVDTFTRMDGAKVVPGLASSWKTVDNTTWEFKIRPNVKFHNGEAFDSASMEATLKAYFERKSGPGVRLVTVESWTAPEPDTFRIKTKVPDAVLPTKLAQIPIIPAKYYAEKGAEGFSAAPIGTGPFQVVSYERDKQVTLKAYPQSWRPPKVADLVFRQIPDVATQITALRAGEIDLMQLSSKSQYDDLKSKNFKVYNTVIGSTTVLDLKTIGDDPINKTLADKRVRQALNLAFNHKEFTEAVFGNLTPVLNQIPNPVSLGYDSALPALKYDVAQAKTLFQQAGVNPADLKFSIEYFAGSVGRTETIEALIQYWGELGIKVEGAPLNPGVYFQKFNANQMSPIAIISRVFSPNLDGGLAVEWFTTAFGRLQRYNNDQLNTLYNQSLAEFDSAKRETIIKQMNKIVMEDYASVPLFYGFDIFASSDKVEGFKASPNGYLLVENVTKKP
jgi:peptide/nickel transport system substrate-binding protein